MSTHSSATHDIVRTRRDLHAFLAQRERTPAPSSEARAERPAMNGSPVQPGLDWSALVSAGLRSWWQVHPARAGAHLVRSATEDFARRRPLQVVAVAAVAGAALVLLKPWRLVSTTAILLSLFRSSNFTGVATSMLESAAQSLQKESP